MTGIDPYRSEVVGLRDRLNAVIRQKWPETLADDATPFAWAREHLVDLMVRYDRLEGEVEAQWQNSIPLGQFKQTCLEWGKSILEIFKAYSKIT